MAKRAVVTGASSGIGEASARLLRARGWDVVAVARRGDRLEKLAAQTGADPFVADLTRQEDVDALRDHLAATGPVHSLINVAGGAFGFDSVEKSSTDDWIRMYDVNVIAVKRLISALLPLLRDGADAEGVADILTVTSLAGHTAYAGGGGYNAAKFGAHALMAALRLEMHGEPIRIIEVAPGLVATEEFSLVRFGGDRARRDAVYEGVENPLTGEDVAEAIVDAVEKPSHVSVDLVVLKPVAQTSLTQVAKGRLEVKRA